MTSRPGSDRPTPDQDGDANAASPSSPSGTSAVDRIVERFGGIRPMANKLDTPVTTVQGWKKRGAIPLARHADLRAAAARHRIKLDDADLDAATPTEDRSVAEGATPSSAPTPIDAVLVPPAPPADAAPVDGAPASDAAKAESAPEPVAQPVGEPIVEPVIEPATPTPDPDAPKLDAATPEAPAPESTSTGYAKPDTSSEPPRMATIAPAPSYVDEPRSGSGFATALSILALLVGATALAEPWWGPRLPGWPATSGAPAAVATPADPALRAQLQQLADRLGRLEQRPASTATDTGTAAAPTAPSADTSGLEATLGQLAERIDGLEKRPVAEPAAAPPPDPRVAQLTERFGGIEQRLTAVAGNSQAAQDLRKELDALKQQVATVSQNVDQRRDAAIAAQALVLAAGQLRASLAAGQPFQQDLQAVRALGIGDSGVTQPLDAVSAFAAKGIPTQAQLTDRFRPLASEIVRAAERGDGSGWIDQVTGKLATLITVRRQGGGVVGTSPDAIVARAEAAVNENNLAKAVEELSALQGAGAEAAAPWLTDAKARLAADQAGRQLNDRAIALLTTAAGGAAGGKGAAQ